MTHSQPLHIPYIEGIDTKSSEQILHKTLVREGVGIKIDKVNWPQNFPDCRQTEVFLAHDKANIYLLFQCEGEDLKAEVDADLGPVANDSCVEFFVMPDNRTKRYWNFEFNAIGRKNVSHRIIRPEPTRLSATELSRIVTLPSAGSEPFSERHGMQKWALNVIIPLDLLGIDYQGKPILMSGNFYKCGAKTSSPHYLSFGPIDTDRPDFHRPEFFVPIVLD